MPGMDSIGRWLIIIGVMLVVVGGVIWLLAKFFPNLSQFPGTIRIQGAGVTCFFPLLASIVLSILLTIILNIVARFLNR